MNISVLYPMHLDKYLYNILVKYIQNNNLNCCKHLFYSFTKNLIPIVQDFPGVGSESLKKNILPSSKLYIPDRSVFDTTPLE